MRWLQSLTASSEQLLVSQYNVSLLGIVGKWGERLHLALGPIAYVAWAGLALSWLAVLLWAERQARARAAPFLRFWSASWAWAGVVVLNPLVWPYWLLLCVPLFLAYIAECTGSGLQSVTPRVWSVCAFFAAMNWCQNYGIVHQGGSLLAVLWLMAEAYRLARTRDAAQLARLSAMHPAFPRG